MIALFTMLSGLSIVASAPAVRVAYVNRAQDVSGYMPDLQKALERKLVVSLVRVDDLNIEPSHLCTTTELPRIVYVEASLSPMHAPSHSGDSAGPSIYGMMLSFTMYDCTFVRQISAVRVGNMSSGDAKSLSTAYARTLAQLLERIGNPK